MRGNYLNHIITTLNSVNKIIIMNHNHDHHNMNTTFEHLIDQTGKSWQPSTVITHLILFENRWEDDVNIAVVFRIDLHK